MAKCNGIGFDRFTHNWRMRMQKCLNRCDKNKWLKMFSLAFILAGPLIVLCLSVGRRQFSNVFMFLRRKISVMTGQKPVQLWVMAMQWTVLNQKPCRFQFGQCVWVLCVLYALIYRQCGKQQKYTKEKIWNLSKICIDLHFLYINGNIVQNACKSA